MSNVDVRPLIPLPNRDLWRGHVYKYRPNAGNVDGTVQNRPFAKIDAAMAAILSHAAGNATLTCLWCGMQNGTEEMREHLKSAHPSVVEPPTDAQIAMALQAETAVNTKLVETTKEE